MPFRGYHIILHKQLYIAILLCILLQEKTTSFAQISDRLYQLLPPDFKPEQQLNPTIEERRKILMSADDLISVEDTTSIEELNKLCKDLLDEIKYLKNADQVRNLLAVNDYYRLFKYYGSSNGEWVPFAQRAIALIGKDTSLYRELNIAYSSISMWQSLQGQYEMSINTSLKALDISRVISDSNGISRSYSWLAANYLALEMYDDMLKATDKAWEYNSLASEPEEMIELHRINDFGAKAEVFIDWYNSEKKKQYLDSAWKYIHLIPLNGKYASWYKEIYSSAKGKYYFAIGYYDTALTYFNQALINEDYLRDRHLINQIHKGICLYATGHQEEGKKLFLTNELDNEPDLAAFAYEQLYKTAKKHGDVVNALAYFEKAKQYEDAAAILKHRGKVFEVKQKYDLQQKENEINTLELKTQAQERQHNLIFIIGLLTILLLLSVITLLINRNKRRKLKSKQVQLTLENILLEEEEKIRFERDKATNSQRLKISRDLHDGLTSSLAALKFYINDKQLHIKDKVQNDLLQNIREEVEYIYNNTRQYMHQLAKGEDITAIDLNSFFEMIQERFNDKEGFLIRLEVNKHTLLILKPVQQTQLYYIIKEAITNTLKHAGPSAAMDIRLFLQDNNCHFHISDNGKNVSENTQKGLGLDNITQRILSLKGTVNIGKTEKGFILEGTFPL